MAVHWGGRGPGHLSRNTFPNSFSPLALFAASEPGGWYDPSDLSTLFQDSAGTTPVTAAGQSVGLWLDKSGRGNHLSQSSSGQRAIYGVEPVGGRRNLLTYTEQFDNAAWSKTNVTVTANAAVAPDATTTADKLVETTANGAHGVTQTAFTVTPSTAYTVSIYAKASERSWVSIDPVNPGVSNNQTFFNLANGTIGTSASGNTAVITALGDGWYRCSVTRTATSTQTTMRLEVLLATGNGTTTYTGDGTSGILIWGGQGEVGSTATAYQRVVTAFDVTEAGVASLSYIQFDGSDDGYVSPTITPGIDKAQVFAGVRKLSDAGTAMLLETGTTLGNGGLSLVVPQTTATGAMRVNSQGTSLASVDGPTQAAPITFLQTVQSNIAGDSLTLRLNGTQVGSSASDQGTGNYAANALYVGRRGGTSLPFNGRIYSLIVRFGANLSASTITQTENWVAGKTGITI